VYPLAHRCAPRVSVVRDGQVVVPGAAPPAGTGHVHSGAVGTHGDRGRDIRLCLPVGVVRADPQLVATRRVVGDRPVSPVRRSRPCPAPPKNEHSRSVRAHGHLGGVPVAVAAGPQSLIVARCGTRASITHEPHSSGRMRHVTRGSQRGERQCDEHEPAHSPTHWSAWRTAHGRPLGHHPSVVTPGHPGSAKDMTLDGLTTVVRPWGNVFPSFGRLANGSPTP
jgi:hypothetical protein